MLAARMKDGISTKAEMPQTEFAYKAIQKRVMLSKKPRHPIPDT
jgi:hypothetical protein